MSELTFCKQFLTALDSRPIKLSSDYIADPRTYSAQPAYVLPKLPHPPHPLRPEPKLSQTTADASQSTSTGISITLKPMKPSSLTSTLSSINPSNTSIYDLKQSYSKESGVNTSKIKILWKKKPTSDSKTVAEVIGADAGDAVEFSVMLMGGATATAVASPPAVAPTEDEKGLRGPAAQGPSGKDVVAKEEFWEDLKGFVVQRVRDEKEGERLVGVFRRAWEKDR
ncbi:hypothetical protein K469DRAFT_637789 [Zopfia rhizophila CBS 207.26]|uniref:Ubiquitin-like domain-containing protein n=1 Tax=Zopfia rhizophila CBS 207.26 TaxID=1314779 RepID=A0A6A6DRN2_9PEZI|nr:hypothetical protein K469DRAFT_637789 [Zopfia rhizophila CBS 207.26]